MTTRALLGLGLALALAVLVAAPDACAQAPPRAQLDEASGHFNRGVSFYRDGDYRSALVEFLEAQRIAPNYRVLYNIGQTYDELSDFAGALQALRAYLAEGAAAIPKARRAEVEKSIKRLEARVAVVRVEASEIDAELSVEGDRRIELGRSPLPSPAVLNGGRWTVRARKAGFEVAEETLVLSGGDMRTVTLKLARAPCSATAVTAGGPASGGAGDEHGTRSTTPLWIGGAVTGAFAVSAVVTGALTLGARSDYDREVGTFPGNAAAIDDAASRTSTFALVTDVLLGAAVVAAAVTAVVYFSGQPRTVGAPGGRQSAPSFFDFRCRWSIR